jgi:hypothetical protein
MNKQEKYFCNYSSPIPLTNLNVNLAGMFLMALYKLCQSEITGGCNRIGCVMDSAHIERGRFQVRNQVGSNQRL